MTSHIMLDQNLTLNSAFNCKRSNFPRSTTKPIAGILWHYVHTSSSLLSFQTGIWASFQICFKSVLGIIQAFYAFKTCQKVYRGNNNLESICFSRLSCLKNTDGFLILKKILNTHLEILHNPLNCIPNSLYEAAYPDWEKSVR